MIEDMYIERVPNRESPPAVLLRESYREGGKVRKRTLANLSKWPDELVRGLRVLLKGGVALKSMDDAFEILRSRPTDTSRPCWGRPASSASRDCSTAVRRGCGRWRWR